MPVANNRSSIIQLADYGAPYSGNFIASLFNLSDAVHDELGLETILMLPTRARKQPWTQSVRERGISMEFLDENLSCVKRLFAVESIAKVRQAVILHSHFSAFDLAAAFANYRLKIGSVWHLHSNLAARYSLKQRLKDLIKSRVIAHLWVDRIVSVSDSVAKDARRRGLPESKITTIHNGVDLSRVKKIDDKRRAALRRRYHIPEDYKVFLLFGWHPRIKGADLFARAARLLAESGHTKTLCLIVMEKAQYNMFSRLTDCDRYVRILEPTENVCQLFAIADCYVSASRAEAFSYAIAEAMASGLPVLSSNISSLEFYKTAGAGYLEFRSEDVHDLANSLGRIAELSPGRLRQMGKLNQNYATNNLAIDRWCRKVIALYRSILHE